MGCRILDPTAFDNLLFPLIQATFTLTDVRKENSLLQKRLNNYISVETMKELLENKDKELAEAWKNAGKQTKLVEDSLKDTEQLKKFHEALKKTASTMKGGLPS